MMLAIKVMYDRVRNSSKVADFFDIPAKTAWRYATQEDHDRRTPVYKVNPKTRRAERKRKLKILSEFILLSIGDERGGQSRLARETGLARQEIYHAVREKHFFRRPKLEIVLNALNASAGIRRELGLNQ